jgi:hypothetical protein
MFNKPSGEIFELFTWQHFVCIIICLVAVFIAYKLTKKISQENVVKMTRIFAYVITGFEVVKIIFKLAWGQLKDLDQWLPLSFCSLFIYALWMAGFSRGTLGKTGCSFIMGGCFVGGLAYIIFPTTSLQWFPPYHFISIHSMLFHSAMLYLSLIYIKKKMMTFDFEAYKYYGTYVAIASIVALAFNFGIKNRWGLVHPNLMVIRIPPLTADMAAKFAFSIVQSIYNKSEYLYTVCAVFAYLIVPFAVSLLVSLIIHRKKKSKYNMRGR